MSNAKETLVALFLDRAGFSTGHYRPITANRATAERAADLVLASGFRLTPNAGSDSQ